jgi:VanZ family protein
MRSFFKRYRRSLIWAILILFLCGIPGHHIPEPDFWRWLKWDKLTHLVLFGVLSFLLLEDSTETTLPSRKWSHILIAISYGALIEWLQATVFIGRSGDIRDAIANLIGVLMGWGLHAWLKRRRKHTLGN